MNMQDIISAMLVLAKCDTPVFVWGAPGIGKSDGVRQLARQTAPSALLPGLSDDPGVPVIDMRLSQKDPVDLRGVPSISNGVTVWNPPSEFPREDRDGPVGFFFMDEMNCAPPLVQAAGYQLVLDRRLGDYIFPPGWRIVAAGNRMSDRASAQRQPSALANRFAHLFAEPDVAAWCQWASENGISPLLIAFIRYRPELLHIDLMEPAKRESYGFKPGIELQAFPTPRSVAQCNKVLRHAPEHLRQRLFAANIGDGPAAELEGFVSIWRSLPKLESIIADPIGALVSRDPAVCFALTGALVRKADVSTVDSILTYADRMGGDFSVLTALDIKRLKPELQETPAFVSWCVRNQHVTL